MTAKADLDRVSRTAIKDYRIGVGRWLE